jgi:hypothetical protein
VNAPRTWSVEVEPGWLFMDGVEVSAVAVRETRRHLAQKLCTHDRLPQARNSGHSARWQQQATRDSEWADVGETARLKPGAYLYRLLAVEHLPVVRES